MKKLAVICLGMLLIGCSEQYDHRMSTSNDKDKLHERQSELQKAHFDLSRVSVARLAVDGEKREVTSLMPTNLAKFKESTTIIAFNEKQDQLILFTYDALSGKGYDVSLVLSDFEAKKSIKFPVVNPENGLLVDRTFTLNTLIIR